MLPWISSDRIYSTSWEKAGGLLAERYLSVSTWHELQLQKKQLGVFLLLVCGFSTEILLFLMLM